MRLKITFISLLCFLSTFSQTKTNTDKINSYIENYFRLDRENIHVQFNKNTYVNNEDIGFKGYVLSKNNGKLNLGTANIQLVIYDDQEKIVLKQLLFTNKGTFAGGIHLTETFKSGIYHFHFYTNWMNNFNEDDSFTQKIEIIDKNEPYNLQSTDPNYKTAQVTFFPESGIILDDINNRVGVQLTDCNKKGIQTDGIQILDSKGNEITTFNTNTVGNGSFYFIPSIVETYTLKIKNDKLSVSQPLPKITETGLALSYNNNLPKNILAIALKTNSKGLEIYKGKKYTILIHQDGNSIQKELTFTGDETEQVVLFDKKFISNGVNSIRLLDENLNEIAERLLYEYRTDKAVTTLEAKNIANDSILLLGKTDTKNASVSISILPKDNVHFEQNKSIAGSFFLNAYLEHPENNNYLYFDQNNPTQKQDMDVLMLNQPRSKFLWENIKNNPPKTGYTFNKGVTISGAVEKNTTGNTNYRISLISLKNSVFEETPIDKNSNFKFEHFFAQDSTVFLLQMINEKSVVKFTKMEARVTSDEQNFHLPIPFEKNNCPVEKKPENAFTFSKSAFDDGAVDLAGVTVQNNFKKEIFAHKGDMSLNATAFKMDETDFGNVLDFIGRNGFRTGIDPEENTAYIRNTRDAFSDNPPAVYIDNVQQTDFNLLYSLDLTDVDEIYIDKSGASDTAASVSGTIKIFLKVGADKNDYFRAKYTSLLVTTGFAKNINFKNATFESQKEYFYFGTLNWTPTIEIKDNPNYELRFPKTGQTEIKVLVEGIAEDGQVISEIQTIPVK
ncbi:hypothetical protein FFWV33_00805 [Flavobacterium faecale]|uniref:Uncharacterized protein n=1 Tax=Flavobacterium faecale TaxID=1355330 RepID=A0A2S1L8T2_9FLAO|nr:hypothetical protein [Flavobacterium faecale]AWG20162.1 hypothetical protein FFWV33_00805 [Flavobacterium faecale]